MSVSSSTACQTIKQESVAHVDHDRRAVGCINFQVVTNLHSDTVRITGDSMAISHELSSEIAAALFAAKERSAHQLNDLKEIVFKIHSTLEQFSDEDRLARMARVDPHAPQPENLQAGKAQPDVKARSAGKHT